MIRRRPGACLAISIALVAASGCGAGVSPLAIARVQMAFPAAESAPGTVAGSPGAPTAPPAQTPSGTATSAPLPPTLPAAGGAVPAGGGAVGGGGAPSGGGAAPSAPETLPDPEETLSPSPEASTEADPTAAPTATPGTGTTATPTPTPGVSPTPTPTPTPTPAATATPSGMVITWAGNGTAGNATGTGTAARFNTPYGVASDASGNVYVADAFNHLIRKITPAGVVTTVAGTGQQGHQDGAAGQARFNSPLDLAAQADGTLYVSDTLNHCIRKITPQGVVSTLAGAPAIAYDAQGYPLLSYPVGIAVTTAGTVYVADPGLQAIRAIAPSGVVSNLAGKYWDNEGGLADGTGTGALFQEPMDLALDPSGNLVVADTSNHRIRKVTPQGVVTTLAGSGGTGGWGGGFADGAAGSAMFKRPYGVAVDAAGNIYVADRDNQRLRKLTPGGSVSTPAGSGVAGRVDGLGGTARFNAPVGLTFDARGRLAVADSANHAVRLLYP